MLDAREEGRRKAPDRGDGFAPDLSPSPRPIRSDALASTAGLLRGRPTGSGDHIRRGDPADPGWFGMSVRLIPAAADGDGRLGLRCAGERRDSKTRVARDHQPAHPLEEK